MIAGTELLRRYVADRSEAAFAVLVQQHLPLVYHAALRRTNGDAHLAEEVAQTVFASLAKEAAALQHHAVLTGWLYVATRHAAANAMRSEQRRKTREQEAYTMNEPATPALPGMDWEELRPEIDSVMDELNEADRNAVLLRFFENRPYSEIGASFQISEDAARMRVDRALEKLRTLLARRGITSTAAALGGLLVTQAAGAAPAGLATAVTGSVLAGTAVAATATGTAGFIALMTTNKIVLGIAAAVALVAGGTAVYEHQEVARTERSLAAVTREMTGLKNRLAATEAERDTLAQKRQVAPVASAGGNAQPAPGPTGARPAGSALPTLAAITAKMDILYANPEYVQLELERTALGLRERYGALYKRLGLSDAQIREFESLMLEQQQGLIDVFAAARAKGVSINDPSLRQLNDPAQQAIQAKLEALLGPEGAKALKAYHDFAGSSARSAVGNLAMRTYAIDPITLEQAERLTDIIAANTTKPPPGSGFLSGPGIQDWSTIYIQAREVLTPEQLAALQAANRAMEISLQQSQLSDKLLQEAATNAAN